MKRYLKWILIPGALVLSPVIILVEICIVFFVIGSIFIGVGNFRDWQTKNKIFDYVLENKDSIEIDAPFGHQAFHYTSTGSWDTEVNYGYYYSPEDAYLFTHEDPLYDKSGIYGSPLSLEHSTPYEDGYREDGIYGDPLDWYYTEKICDNWYYYELHDV